MVASVAATLSRCPMSHAANGEPVATFMRTTTDTDMIRAVLANNGPTVARTGRLNATRTKKMGVALTLQNTIGWCSGRNVTDSGVTLGPRVALAIDSKRVASSFGT